jgi:hypothetical protein
MQWEEGRAVRYVSELAHRTRTGTRREWDRHRQSLIAKSNIMANKRRSRRHHHVLGRVRAGPIRCRRRRRRRRCP